MNRAVELTEGYNGSEIGLVGCMGMRFEAGFQIVR